VQNVVCQTYGVEWKRNAFFLFVENYKNTQVSTDLKVKILTTIIIPSFAVSFEKDEGNALIGAPPNPYQEDDNNIVSVFINKVIDPEKSMDDDDDPLRIALLQFACLLVERSSAHIHDGGSSSKKEGSKLRRLMTLLILLLAIMGTCCLRIS
jgi:transformation/transcription domain-associated protein